MRVFVAGKLVQRTFEAEGQKRQTVEIQVTNVVSLRSGCGGVFE